MHCIIVFLQFIHCITVIVLPLLYYRSCITVIVLPFFIHCIHRFSSLSLRPPASRLLRLDQAIWTSGSAEKLARGQKVWRSLREPRSAESNASSFRHWLPPLWLGHGGQLPPAAGPRQEGARVEDLVPEHWVLTSLLVSFSIPEEDVVFSRFQTLLYPPPAEGNPVWRLRVMRVHFWKTPQNSSLLVTPILESNQLASKASGTQSQVLP